MVPVIALPRRPLSKRTSTASCSMRFSLRMMISGALSSWSLFRRLFRLITRRYKSLRSDVAKRPPSRGTNGRKSGGITGRTVKIIHSGLFPDLRKDSTTFNRFTSFFFLVSETEVIISARSSSYSFSRSISSSNCLIASAPIPATKPLEPYCSRASSYSSSVSKSFFFRGVSFGSSTIQDSK